MPFWWDLFFKSHLPMSRRKIDRETYDLDPARYNLVRGTREGAPLCPFGNRYKWVGFDSKEQKYIRLTKRVYKNLISRKEAIETLP